MTKPRSVNVRCICIKYRLGYSPVQSAQTDMYRNKLLYISRNQFASGTSRLLDKMEFMGPEVYKDPVNPLPNDKF